jgi:hypothetical protein
MTDFKLNTLGDERYKVIKPFDVIISRALDSDFREMIVESPDRYLGRGFNWSQALVNLQKSLIEDFEFLIENEDRLGKRMQEMLAIFREHLVFVELQPGALLPPIDWDAEDSNLC